MSEEQIKEQAVSDMASETGIEQKSQKQLILEFLEANKPQLRLIADQIATRFHNNWFTIDKLIKKTGYKTIEDAVQILQYLCLSNFCITKLDSGVEKFKISFDLKEKLALLDFEIKQIQKQYDEKLFFLTCNRDDIAAQISREELTN